MQRCILQVSFRCIDLFDMFCIPQSTTGDATALSLKHCNILQHAATNCNTLQSTAGDATALSSAHWNTLQYTATHCDTLQPTATDCNTLQHTATQCHTPQHTATHFTYSRALRVTRKLSRQHTATHCNTL